MNLNVEEIIYHSGLRPLNSDRVAYYKKEFEQGREVPPISVDAEMNLVDGSHRLAAARLLKHKTIAAELHVASPMDLPNNRKIADAISTATKEAVSRVPFIDRRDAIQIRDQLFCKQSQIAAQETEQASAEQSITKYTGQLVSLRAQLKKYISLLDKAPHYSGNVDETSLKIRKVEHELAFYKKDLERIQRIIASHKKLLKQWLAETPGKGFPTNAELLRLQDELRKLEADGEEQWVGKTVSRIPHEVF